MINCTFENGNKNSLRHVVIDALVLKGNEILLVKRSNKLLEGGKWAVVGGFMERDENLYQTVEREVREETGYTIKDITFLYVMHSLDSPGEDRQNIKFVFFCTALDKEGEHDWEESDVEWFALDELPEPLAFDHKKHIELYQQYKRNEITIPLLQP